MALQLSDVSSLRNGRNFPGFSSESEMFQPALQESLSLESCGKGVETGLKNKIGYRCVEEEAKVGVEKVGKGCGGENHSLVRGEGRVELLLE